MQEFAHLAELGICCVLFIVLGGAVISELENAHAQEATSRTLERVRIAFDEARLNETQIGVLYKHGVLVQPQSSQWDLLGGVFYCLQLVTTIGYGSFTPQTSTGRVFSVLYCLSGILLLTYTMSHIAELLVDKLAACAQALAFSVRPRRIDDEGKLTPYGKQLLEDEFERYARADTHSLSEEELAGFLTVLNDGRQADKRDVRFIIARANRHGGGDITFEEFESAIEAWYEQHPVRPMFEGEAHAVMALSLCLMGGCLSTYVYSTFEGWEPSTAAWFVFISVTTVGFGDFVPVSSVGMAWLSVVVVFDLGMLSYFVKSMLDLAAMRLNRQEQEELQQRLHSHLALPVDTTGDGVFDSIFVDTTGDGKLDFWAPIAPFSPVGAGVQARWYSDSSPSPESPGGVEKGPPESTEEVKSPVAPHEGQKSGTDFEVAKLSPSPARRRGQTLTVAPLA
eukprot:Hpha_TRINITY_DN8813_c0_g2::TRINITY_DN8813_c0_g2_i1::g.141701::m.141701